MTLAHFGFGRNGEVLDNTDLPAALADAWEKDETTEGQPFPTYARLLSARGTPAGESRYSWTVDFAARRKKAREDMKQYVAVVQRAKAEVVSLKEKLKALKARGVDVEVIVDKTAAARSRGSHYSAATYLSNAGIPVWVDARVAIAHSKVIVIDDQVVITGSFNFTKAAQERNAENLLVIRDATLSTQYRLNWERRRAMSVTYAGAGPLASGRSANE